MITGTEYQQAVLRTTAVKDQKEMLLLAAVGMSDELGEISQPLRALVADCLTEAATRQLRAIKDECGDWMWYAALATIALEGDFEALISNSFIEWVQRNFSYIVPMKKDDFSANVLLDVVEAVSRFLGLMKKVHFHKHPLAQHIHQIQMALADSVYRFCYLCSLLDIDIRVIMEENKAKLEKRYPQGFDTARSLNRAS